MRTHGVKQGRWVGVCGVFFLCPECRAAEEAERVEKMEAGPVLATRSDSE